MSSAPTRITLHILNKSPEHPRFHHCLASVSGHDALVLTENAVLALADNTITLPARCFVLVPDLEARSLTSLTRAQTTDYAGLVRLTTKYERVISW